MSVRFIVYFVFALAGTLGVTAFSRPRMRARHPEKLQPLGVDIVQSILIAGVFAAAPFTNSIFPQQMSYIWRGITYGVLVATVFWIVSFLASRLWKPPAKR